MNQPSRAKVGWLAAGLCAGLLVMGVLRLAGVRPGVLSPLAGLATPGYIGVTVVISVLLIRAGLPLNRLGFGSRLTFRHIGLALAAVAVLQAFDLLLAPTMERVLGARDLERFANVPGSPWALAKLLTVSWTFAAFGEELAYRIVLMRAVSYALGDTRRAIVTALLLQAAVFGFAHAYQGAAGVMGSAISGLVFGAVTLAGRRAIWPSALAHGGNNTIGILTLYLS